VSLTPTIRLLRPKQWTKNLLVFAALIFAHEYTDVNKVVLALIAFAALCFFSSSVYAMNDVFDAERDRAHPKKMHRPIASGELSPGSGSVIAVVALIAGTLLAAFVSPSFLAGVFGYLVLQLFYNLWLKHVPVVDVMVVATGFVMRAALGAIAIDAHISGWLLFCTGMLALLLGTAKRRHEFHLQGDERGASRAALLGYTGPSLDAMVVFSAGVAAIAYGVYAIESDTARTYPSLIVTVPFVVFGVLRYLYLTFAKGDGGEPENVLLSDWQIIAAVVLFVLAAFYALSGLDIPFFTNPVRG
jgi:4-hydroxybenzoate polyprenyltransferase